MKKGDATRQRILEAAARCFQVKGFSQTSMQDLIAETGLTKGALYFHFPGKEELAVAVLEQSREELRLFLDSAIRGDTPAEQLGNYGVSLVGWLTRLNFVGGCIFANTAMEMADVNERFAKVVLSAFDLWRTRLTSLIEEGQQTGDFRTDIEAQALATLAFTAFEGGILLSRLEKSEAALAACCSTLQRLIIREQISGTSPDIPIN